MSLTHQLFLQSIREAESLPPDAFDRYRAPLLQQLLDHAWRGNAFYRERLVRLVEGGALDMSRWIELPVLRETDLPGGTATLEVPGWSQPINPTERGNGAPRSQLARIAEECERERLYERLGMDLAAPLAIVDPDLPERTGKGWSITFPESPWERRAPQTVADLDAWLARFGARQVTIPANLVERLLADPAGMLRAPIDILLLTRMPGSGDGPPVATVPVRQVAEFARYPAIGFCACQPASAEAMVSAATALVEVVDPAGRPATAMEMGELVVTPLYEYAAPRLRWGTGVVVQAPREPRTALGVRSLGGLSEGR